MLQSMVVGIDGSVYSTSAVELGIRWAQRWDAVLVGLGIVDTPTICKAQPVSLGATAYKAHRDNNYGRETLLVLRRGARVITGGRMDVVYVVITIAFFVLSWGLIALCERL